MIQPKVSSKSIQPRDPLHYERPMIRARTKKFKQALNSLFLYIMRNMVDLTSSASMELNKENFKLVCLISYFEPL